MDIRRHARIAECTGEDGVKVAAEHGEAVGRNGGSILEIAVGSPIKIGQLDGRSRSLDAFHGLRNDFFTDAVSGDDRDLLFAHGSKSITGSCQWAVSSGQF